MGKAAELLSTEGNDRIEEKRCEAPGVQCWVGGPDPGRQQLWSPLPPLPPLPGERQAALAQAGAASHHGFLSYTDLLPGHHPPAPVLTAHQPPAACHYHTGRRGSRSHQAPPRGTPAPLWSRPRSRPQPIFLAGSKSLGGALSPVP